MTYLAESNRLIVTDGGNTDAVELVDCKDYKIIDTLKLGQGVDHSAYNPLNGHFYVENGGGPDRKKQMPTIIYTKSFKKIRHISRPPPPSHVRHVTDTPP